MQVADDLFDAPERIFGRHTDDRRVIRWQSEAQPCADFHKRITRHRERLFDRCSRIYPHEALEIAPHLYPRFDPPVLLHDDIVHEPSRHAQDENLVAPSQTRRPRLWQQDVEAELPPEPSLR